MSFPNIPNITPTISITREQVINLLLASIALEELGLAHIVNAEAEKLQFVLGTLPDSSPLAPPTFEELLTANRSVEEMLRTVVKKEMLLEFKLEDVLKIPPEQIIHVFEDIATATAIFDGITVKDIDVAFYHTEEVSGL